VKLFHWKSSTALKQYATGDIIVMAETVDDARGRVMSTAGEYWYESRIYDSHFDCISEFDADDWREFRYKLYADLQQEPLVVTSGVVMIKGST
jgi:hypothetical protein